MERVEEMVKEQQQGKIGATEFRIVRPDGNIRWICNRYFPVMDDAGKLKQITGLAENITEFKRAEEILLRSQEELEKLVKERTAELAKANAALKETEEHFRQLFATIPLPVWLYSEPTYAFLEVNEAAIEHYGYSRDEFLHKTLEDIHLPHDLEQMREDEAKLGDTPMFFRNRKHRTRDGTVIDVETSASRVYFTGVPSILMATVDVTERIRMEMELRHGQKLQAVGELAAGVAHEINMPIQFVGNNAEFLQNSLPSLMKLLEMHEEAFAAVQDRCTPAMAEQIKAAKQSADLPF